MKISKSGNNNNNNNIEAKESVSAKSFYSKKEDPQASIKRESNSSEPKKESKPKKVEKSINKQLGTWQADVQAQLALPTDFTPELIAELAAAGYDVVSGASRKARQRQQSTLATSVAALQDSSDEEKMGVDSEYQGASGAQSKSKPTNDDKNRANNRITKVVVKYDGEDPNENPAFKRFNQILSKIKNLWLHQGVLLFKIYDTRL